MSREKSTNEPPEFEYEQIARLAAERDALKLANERLREALREISEGRGRFSLDNFEHARNTIEDMKELALAALAPATPTQEPQ